MIYISLGSAFLVVGSRWSVVGSHLTLVDTWRGYRYRLSNR